MPFDNADLLRWTLFDGKGTIAGLILVVLLLLLLTGPARRKIRWVLLYLVLHLLFLSLSLLFEKDGSAYQTLRDIALFLLVTALGLSIFLLLTQSRLSRAFMKPLPQIFIDIVHSFVYVIALLVTLSAAGVKPIDLFAGSAVLTAIIGLSLRDTLGNLFAGLAIQAQRPFDVGDWIQFNQDQTQIGRVTEINWRATTVVTKDLVEIIVPNGFLALTPILNYSRPEKHCRRSVLVHGPFDVPPLRVKQIILAALVNAPGVRSDPAPSVETKAFVDCGIQYAVKFFVVEFSAKGKAESVVCDRIWYALARHGIEMPIPPRAVRMQKAGKRSQSRLEENRVAQQEKALRHVDFFDHLPEDARRQLAARAHTRLYAEGEVIIQQGDQGSELFIIEAGEVVVAAARPGEGAVQIARMGPGDFFGEMAALTGEERKATVRATRECELLVVGKSALAQVFESSPELAEHVSQTIARRQANLAAQLSEHASALPHVLEEHSNRLLERIKKFFSI